MWAGAALSGEDPRRPSSWVRWDSYRYIDVARRGYVEVPDDPTASNTGWFPAYPYLVRLFALPLHASRRGSGEASRLASSSAC